MTSFSTKYTFLTIVEQSTAKIVGKPGCEKPLLDMDQHFNGGEGI